MELRKDYILDRWVIIATERQNRPKQFKSSISQEGGICFFCPCNEHMTPPEIGRISNNNSWRFRWFSNKFPFVSSEGNPNVQTHNDFFTFASAYGHHEVIVETPNHNEQLWDLSEKGLAELFQIYNARINELSKRQNIKYVVVFKNHGKEGGTSLVHSHTQIVAENFMPKTVRDECMCSKNDCPYCRILNIEKNSYRRCFENEHFVAFTPYASRFNMEIWVFSKRHVRQMNEFNLEEYSALAEIMKKILNKLRELNAPFNYILHYSPSNENLHFHIEVLPRLATWAGFEYATETIINTISPEDAARYYRGE